MGECLISRRGGEAYSLPVLNESYPQDVIVPASANGVSAFSVQISEHGKPSDYSYQWYVNGSIESGATGASFAINTTKVGTYTIYCVVTNKAGTVTSRAATLTIKDCVPEYSYDGVKVLTKEDDYNWNLAFKTSGTLKVSEDAVVDVFLVGGGGGGGYGTYGGGGGGGGYTTTATVSLVAGQNYDIVIGAGGVGGDWGVQQGGTGGTTSAFGQTAAGGTGGSWDAVGGSGGSGGGSGSKTKNRAGGAGGSDGSNGSNGAGGAAAGTGQKTTTRAFGESNGALYAGGGGGGSDDGQPGGAAGNGGGGTGGVNANVGGSGTANTGGGGGGGGGNDCEGGIGGSGIVIIRNAR